MNTTHRAKKVTYKCALCHLSFMPKSRLVEITSSTSIHLYRTRVGEGKQTILLCHVPLVVQQTLNLI